MVGIRRSSHAYFFDGVSDSVVIPQGRFNSVGQELPEGPYSPITKLGNSPHGTRDFTDVTPKGTFDFADFTQVTGTSSTLSDTAVDSTIEYSDLSITIDNTLSPKTARIEGYLKITHGYDSGGHTLVALDVNDILQNA